MIIFKILNKKTFKKTKFIKHFYLKLLIIYKNKLDFSN